MFPLPSLPPAMLLDADTVDPEFWKDRPSKSHAEAIDWVAEHMHAVGLKAEDAPNGVAFGLLMWAQESKGSTATFWSQILPKRLPTRSQVDDDGGFTDDGRKDFEFMGQIMAPPTTS